jgi:hypothetical protein
MTRAAQVTQAVSAMRKARATPSSLPQPAWMAFLIYEDNGGGYHWTIVADGGKDSDSPPLVELPTRRSAARDRLDAERWLDEDGSFSSEAVTG